MKRIAVELDVYELDILIHNYYEQLDYMGCDEEECTCHEQSIIGRRISELEKSQKEIMEGE